MNLPIDLYIDQNGFPGTRQADNTLDMGDSAAIYFNVAALSINLPELSDKYFDGIHDAPVRHPDSAKWWGQPDRFSRDQLIPILCYAAIRQVKNDFIQKIYVSHKKRYLLLAWNTKRNGAIDVPDKFPDITGPEILGLWLRVHQPFGCSLVLPLLDLETLVNAILWRWFQPVTNRVTRNHLLVASTQRKVLPTFVSKLADKINNYNDLIKRWNDHCLAVGEYPTAELFTKDRE